MKSRGVIAPFIMEDISDSLRFLGHEVLLVDMEKAGLYSTSPHNLDHVVNHTIETLKSFQPNFIFSYGLGGVIMTGANDQRSNLFEILDIPYVTMFYDAPENDDFWRLFGHSSRLHVTCWDRTFISYLRNFGVERIIYSPLATNIRRFNPTTITTPTSNIPLNDVSFIGSINGSILEHGLAKIPNLSNFQKIYVTLKLEQPCRSYRALWEQAENDASLLEDHHYSAFKHSEQFHHFRQDTIALSDAYYRLTFLQKLSEHVKGVNVFGNSDWQSIASKSDLTYQGKVDYSRQTPIVYANSKINLNLTNSQLISAVNQRIFDAAAVGGFVLTDHKEDLKDLFSSEEVATFETMNELIEKTDYYLTHTQERSQITKALQDQVLRKHSWDIRMQDLLDNLLMVRNDD